MLGSKTTAGKRAMAAVREALGVIERRHGITHSWLSEKALHTFDGFITKDNTVVGVFEAKSRAASYEDGCIKYGGVLYPTYLITSKKLENGAVWARKFNVPFFLLVNLEESGHVLSFMVSDKAGKILVDFEEKASTTQATVNGGYMTRANSFIPISQALVFDIK